LLAQYDVIHFGAVVIKFLYLAHEKIESKK
jgi:hypothetical protein